jgi:hypothetical protein
MSVRWVSWVVGFVAAAVVAAAVPESLFPGVRLATFGAFFLSIGLMGEWLQTLHERSGAGISAQPLDLRPADGRVEITALARVRREPNSIDPRFGRFVGMQPSGQDVATRAASLDPLSTGRESPRLIGRVVIVSMFVGKDGHPWTVEEVARSHQALLRAGVWVEQEAQRWGAAVNVEVADTYFETVEDEVDEVLVGFQAEGDSVGPFEELATFKSVVGLTRAAVRWGFRDAEDLCSTIGTRAGGDTAVWMIHPRQAGRSLAVPRELSGLPGVSLAVCYAREASFPEPLVGPARTDPVTVVHELLHLFGATDKYNRPLRDFAPKSVTAREVMRLSETRLSRLRIDPQTALEIGWTGPETPTTPGSRQGLRGSSEL